MNSSGSAPFLSGVTFVRNAVKFDYPLVEAVTSILPLVDEYVLLVCASEDETAAVARSIADAKVRIYESDWDERERAGGRILSRKTDEAIKHARGRWVFYLQADEVVHEDDLPRIYAQLVRYDGVAGVDGLLFDYLHFYGTYSNVQRSRKWYAREVRLLRNQAGLASHGDAQGFRINGRKPRVVAGGARVFHYGWVRPPAAMLAKARAFHKLWHDDAWVERELPPSLPAFDYGPMRSTVPYAGTHPAVMAPRIARAGWTPEDLGVVRYAHDRWPQRALGWLERNVLGRKLGEQRNWVWYKRRRGA